MSFFDTHERGCKRPKHRCVRCRFSDYLVNEHGVAVREIVEGYLNGIGESPGVAVLGEHVGGLGLSKRALNPLHYRRIRTLGKLVTWTENELLRLPHFGRTSLIEVKVALHKRGLRLGMDVAAFFKAERG